MYRKEQNTLPFGSDFHISGLFSNILRSQGSFRPGQSDAHKLQKCNFMQNSELSLNAEKLQGWEAD